MKPLVIEEEAELELIGSIAFYEERKAGLEQGLPVPGPNPNPTIVIQNAQKLQPA